MPATIDSPLAADFEHYLAHQDEYVRQYAGRVIVLKDQVVLGDYASVGDAVRETMKTHDLGTFLVQRVERGTGATTAHFHSRVIVG